MRSSQNRLFDAEICAEKVRKHHQKMRLNDILFYFTEMTYNISKHRDKLAVSNVFNRVKYDYFR